MTQTYTTETGKFVLVDSDGKVVSKVDAPSGDHPVADYIDTAKTFDVDAETDLSAKLSESPANPPNDLPNEADDKAFEKLENVQIDPPYNESAY